MILQTRPFAFLLALAGVSVASAQTTSPFGANTYGTTVFVKCKPGKAQPCEEFLKKTLHNAMQARVEKRLVQLFTLSRVVVPNAIEAGFTHAYSITTAKPVPAEPTEEYQKLGETARGMTQAEFFKQRDDLSEFVSSVRWVQLARAGSTPEIGTFARIDFLKSPAGRQAEVTEFMRTKAMPLSGQFQKDGLITAWVFRGVNFRGSEDPYDAMEITAFKDAQAVTTGMGGVSVVQAAFAKAVPGLSYSTYSDQRNALRHVVKVRVVKLIDVIGSVN